MDNCLLSPIFAGLLNSLTVRVEPWVYNWLTPVWILGLGCLAGIIGVLAIWLIGFALSRIPAIGQTFDNRNVRWMGGAILGLVLFAAWSPTLLGQLRELRAAQVQAGEAQELTDALRIFTPAMVLSVIAGWALISMASRRIMDELPLLLQEGPLFWNSVIIGSFALFGILGTIVIRDPEEMLDSLERWPSLGREVATFPIEASTGDQFADPPEQKIEVMFRRNELRELKFSSNESLLITAFSREEATGAPAFPISGGESLTWRSSSDPSTPLANLETVEALYVRNLSDAPATLTIESLTTPAHPEMITAPIVALAVIGFFLVYVMLYAMFPKMSSIALATAKSEMNTPFYMLLTGAGAFLLFVFLWMPYNTFGEDIKMLKFTSLGIIRVLALLQAIWAASSSVSEEVEGRTALTVLSKPVGRRDFLIGKFVGIAWSLLVMFAVFSAVMLLCVAYKPIFDVREGGKMPDRPVLADPLGLVEAQPIDTGLSEAEVNWQICFAEMAATIPPLVLVYFEALVMAAVSVAISTRLSLVPNFLICFTIFSLGHLTPLLVQSAVVAEKFEAVIFIGRLIATVFPVLEYFDVEAAIASGKTVQLSYVGATFVYTALYSTIAMLLALVLFEDRDLA